MLLGEVVADSFHVMKEINKEVDFQGTNLVRVKFSQASLTGSDLGGANLAGANLAGARLQQVNLQGADLRGANLTGTCFESVSGWTETAQEDDIFPLDWFQPRFAT